MKKNVSTKNWLSKKEALGEIDAWTSLTEYQIQQCFEPPKPMEVDGFDSQMPRLSSINFGHLKRKLDRKGFSSIKKMVMHHAVHKAKDKEAGVSRLFYNVILEVISEKGEKIYLGRTINRGHRNYGPEPVTFGNRNVTDRVGVLPIVKDQFCSNWCLTPNSLLPPLFNAYVVDTNNLIKTLSSNEKYAKLFQLLSDRTVISLLEKIRTELKNLFKKDAKFTQDLSNLFALMKNFMELIVIAELSSSDKRAIEQLLTINFTDIISTIRKSANLVPIRGKRYIISGENLDLINQHLTSESLVTLHLGVNPSDLFAGEDVFTLFFEIQNGKNRDLSSSGSVLIKRANEDDTEEQEEFLFDFVHTCPPC